MDCKSARGSTHRPLKGMPPDGRTRRPAAGRGGATEPRRARYAHSMAQVAQIVELGRNATMR